MNPGHLSLISDVTSLSGLHSITPRLGLPRVAGPSSSARAARVLEVRARTYLGPTGTLVRPLSVRVARLSALLIWTSTGTRVHEYGGGAFCVVSDTDEVIFSHFADGRLWRVAKDNKEPSAVTAGEHVILNVSPAWAGRHGWASREQRGGRGISSESAETLVLATHSYLAREGLPLSFPLQMRQIQATRNGSSRGNSNAGTIYVDLAQDQHSLFRDSCATEWARSLFHTSLLTFNIASTFAESSVLRYAAFVPHPLFSSTWPYLLAVQEDHTKPAIPDVVNRLVLIHVPTGNVRTLAEGADFYSSPKWSPTAGADGSAEAPIIWLEWNHPDMPWESARLFSGTVALDEPSERVKDVKPIAGGKETSVCQPKWDAEGKTVYFIWDKSGFGLLYRWDITAEGEPELAMETLEYDLADPGKL